MKETKTEGKNNYKIMTFYQCSMHRFFFSWDFPFRFGNLSLWLLLFLGSIFPWLILSQVVSLSKFPNPKDCKLFGVNNILISSPFQTKFMSFHHKKIITKLHFSQQCAMMFLKFLDIT